MCAAAGLGPTGGAEQQQQEEPEEPEELEELAAVLNSAAASRSIPQHPPRPRCYPAPHLASELTPHTDEKIVKKKEK